MQYNFNLKLVLHISNSCSFFGLCEDVKVAIKRLKTRYQIFVIKQKNYNLVLGQLFLIFGQIQLVL